MMQNTKTAAFLTHELRSPLTAVLCALQLLKEENPNVSETDKANLLDSALRNAERLNRLIDDIMDSSKIQAGRLEMKPLSNDPVEIIRETALSLQPWAQRNKIRLLVKAEKNLPSVRTDAKRTMQALTNLISNALKFTPEDGTVVVAAERGTREFAGSLVFSVTDTGPGLSAEEVTSVFRYFVQGKKGAQREDGTGLGLPLARSFIEMLGGMMWAERALDKGGTFKFTLPIAIGDEGNPIPASSSVRASTTIRP